MRTEFLFSKKSWRAYIWKNNYILRKSGNWLGHKSNTYWSKTTPFIFLSCRNAYVYPLRRTAVSVLAYKRPPLTSRYRRGQNLDGIIYISIFYTISSVSKSINFFPKYIFGWRRRRRRRSRKVIRNRTINSILIDHHISYNFCFPRDFLLFKSIKKHITFSLIVIINV